MGNLTTKWNTIIMAFLLSTNLSATNYYVSNTGNDDDNDGRTTDKPWRTINKINESSFSPGDSILFKSGDTWRELLRIPSSGIGKTIADSATFITFSSYGSGAKPKLLGSERIDSWTLHPTLENVWKGSKAVINPMTSFGSIGSAYFLHNDGDKVTWYVHNPSSLQDFNQNYHWRWQNDSIYIYWTGNPNTDFAGMEVAQRDRVIHLNDKEYITINGLEIRFGGTRNIGERGAPQNALNGLIVKNCRVSYSGTKGVIDDGRHNGYGISVYHSQMLIKDNEVFGNGRRNINCILQDYGDITVRDVIIDGNICYEAYHANISTGINGRSFLKNFIIRNNYITEDSTETLIAPESEGSNGISILNNRIDINESVDSFFIYNNVIAWNTNHAIQMYNTRRVFIANNTFYGMNQNLPGYRGMLGVSNSDSLTVVNNIFYQTVARNPGDNFMPAIYTNTSDGADVFFTKLDHNIYFALDSLKQPLLDLRDVGGVGEIIYPDAAGRSNNWDVYQAGAFITDRNSLGHVDPMFVNPSGRYGGNYQLQESSPAIGAGTPLSYNLKDIKGNLRDPNFPTIGAFEYMGVDSDAAEIIIFSLEQQSEPAKIDPKAQLVNITVVAGTDIEQLSPTIIPSNGASIDGFPLERSFIDTVTYTVTSANGLINKKWKVVVKLLPSEIVNNKPFVKISPHDSTTCIGFTYSLDASNSYDLDKNDVLSFNWNVPKEISASSLSGSQITILPTENAQENTYRITLSVTDGKDTVYNNIDLGIYNYNKSAKRLRILSLESSDYEGENYPENIVDNNTSSMWSANGDNQWIIFELDNKYLISHFEISFFGGENKNTFFDIYASNDKESWKMILENSASCGFSPNMHAYKMPENKATESYKYIKLVGHMNSLDIRNAYTEFVAYGYAGQGFVDLTHGGISQIIEVYPNPASDHINIETETNSRIRIYDISGAVVYQNDNAMGLNQININFRSGIYFVHTMDENNNTLFTKKLIVK